MLTPFQSFNNGQPMFFPVVLNFPGFFFPVIQNEGSLNRGENSDSPLSKTEIGLEAVKQEEGVEFSPSEASAFKTSKGSSETKILIEQKINKLSTCRSSRKNKKTTFFQPKNCPEVSLSHELQNKEQDDQSKSGRIGWTKQEQKRLVQLVELFGKHWKHISEHLPNRNPKQIRQRYLNYLRSNLSTEKWTPEQDSRLLTLVAEYGHRWKQIEKKMKKRSQNQLKNRYYGHFKKQMRFHKPQLDLSHPFERTDLVDSQPRLKKLPIDKTQ